VWKLKLTSPRRKKPITERESGTELAVGRYLQSQGIFFWKQPMAGFYDANRKAFRKHQSPFVMNGVSDFLAVIDGKIVCLEIKSPSGVQSESQKEFEKQIKAAGGKYFVVRSISDIKDALGMIGEHLRLT
jgi:hypothetical protein